MKSLTTYNHYTPARERTAGRSGFEHYNNAPDAAIPALRKKGIIRGTQARSIVERWM